MGEEGGGHNVLTNGIFSVFLLNVLIYMKNSYFLARSKELTKCYNTHACTHKQARTHTHTQFLPQADWASVSVQLCRHYTYL